MKAIFALLIFLFVARPAHADVANYDPPHERLEFIAMGLSAMAGLANGLTTVTGEPDNVLGAAGFLVGVSTVALNALNDIEHPVGLTATGSIAAVTGLLALRYRHVLDEEARVSIRLAPGVHQTVELVVRF